MQKSFKCFLSCFILAWACLFFVAPQSVIATCSTESVLLDNKYIGACGYTQSTSFTLTEDSDVARIRIWYDTSVGGNTLSATLSGPAGYSSTSGSITKGGCQWSWCEANWYLDQVLKAGTYTLKANSQSVCSNPSGQTTLTLFGCAPEQTEGVDPPYGVSLVDANSNPNDAPVYMGNIVSIDNVATLSGNMELSIDFPAYNRPVDIWIMIALPDGRFYMADQSGNLSNIDATGFLPIATGVSGISTTKQILTPFETGASTTAFNPWPDDGTWTVYWLIAPDSNGDIFEALENGDYELGFYMFDVHKDTEEQPQQESLLKIFTSTQGGTLRTEDKAEITVQAGAVPTKTDGSPGEVSFSIESNIPQAQWPAALPSGYEAVSGLYRFGPSGFIFSGTVQIYLPAGSTTSPSGLVILRYNEATSAWTPLATNDIDSTDRRIGVSVLELGSFILAYNPIFDARDEMSRQTQREDSTNRVGGLIYEHPGENYYYTMTITAVTYANPTIGWPNLVGETAGTGSESTGGPRGFVRMMNIPQGLYTVTLSRTRPGTLSSSPVTYTYSMPIQANVGAFTSVIGWGADDFQGWTHLSLPSGGQWMEGSPTTWPQPTVPYGTGDLGITLTWQNNEGSATDLDLHLYGPDGLHVYYEYPKSMDGSLSLDRDWQSATGQATENIFSSGSYPPGEYKVVINLFDGYSPKECNVRIQRGTQVQTFSHTVTSGNAITVITFQNDGNTGGITGNVIHWVKEFQDDLPKEEPLQGVRVLVGTGFNTKFGAATTLEYRTIVADVTTNAQGAFTASVANLSYDVFFWKEGYVPVSYNTATFGFSFPKVELGKSSTPAHNTLYLEKKE